MSKISLVADIEADITKIEIMAITLSAKTDDYRDAILLDSTDPAAVTAMLNDIQGACASIAAALAAPGATIDAIL